MSNSEYNKAPASESSHNPDDFRNLKHWRIPDENLALLRVKAKLDQQYFSSAEKTWHPLRWVIASAVTAIAAFVLFFVPEIGQNPWNHRSVKVLRIRSSIAPKTISVSKHFSKGFRFQFSPDKKGRLGVKNHWNVQTKGSTQLLVASPRKNQKLKLQKGFIQVYVRPRSMESFVVQVKKYRVTVHGTKFTLERTPNWLRLEVSKGKVSLSKKSRTLHFLPARHGVRVDLKSGLTQRYRIPPPQQSQPFQRWRWMKKNNQSDLLLQYIYDLSESPRFTKQEQLEWLLSAASWAGKHQLLKKSFYLYLRAHSIQSLKEGLDQRLFQAAQACRRAFTLHRKLCRKLYQSYIQKYPFTNPTYKAFSEYWLTLYKLLSSNSRSKFQVLLKKSATSKNIYLSQALRPLLSSRNRPKWKKVCQWLKRTSERKLYPRWSKRWCR